MNSEKPSKPPTGKKGFLFHVDILMEGYNNGIALEALLSILNQAKIKDYKITGGIDLGKIIDITAAQAGILITEQAQAQAQVPTQESKKKAPPKPEEPKFEEAKNDDKDIVKLIEYFKNNNTLIRMTVVKAKGVKLSIPCRVLNFDEGAFTVTVYHVDEKKVYQFHLNEIDELKVN